MNVKICILQHGIIYLHKCRYLIKRGNIMQRLFIGKFVQGNQYNENYYEVPDSSDIGWFGEIQVDDYVLPIQDSKVEKLLRFKGFSYPNNRIRADFDVVKKYSTSFSAGSVLSLCKYFVPNITLLNKISKSTKGRGFHQVELESDCPLIEDIDFSNSTRKFIVILSDQKRRLTFLKPKDICVILSDSDKMEIESIDIYSGQQFTLYQPLWELYNTKNSKAKYTLRELFEYASPSKDNALKKHNFLRAIIQVIENDGYAVVDKPIDLYDNILVGRLVTKKSQNSLTKQQEDINVETDDEFVDDVDLSEYEKYADLLNFNPNIILYGPPGTGKTYGAMRIIEAYEKSVKNKTTFEQVKQEGRANFVTFHQSFSYEEFIEGLRPETDDNGNIRYQVKDGVFKRIAEECKIVDIKENVSSSISEFTNSNSKVWKISLGRREGDSQIYNTFIQNNQIGIGYGLDTDMTNEPERYLLQADPSKMSLYLRDKMQIGDLVLVFNSQRTIRTIGVVTSEYFFYDKDDFGYPHRRSVKWIKKCDDNPIDIYQLNNQKQLTLSSLYELKISVIDVLGLLDEKRALTKKIKPYYLIIDEINRGNIAKIFGELITLIEKDKREKLSSTLPYSGHQFSVPKNLFIIGTMNTSDRSIALLDTALRRRFAFIEISPDPFKINEQDATIGGNVSLVKLLQKINLKLTNKIDRDHRIGHSYFMEDIFTKQDLYYVWYYKVLPLLMEYFYHDVSQISDIVTDKFFDKETGEVIYLDLQPNEQGVSMFELALMSIYQKGE